MGLFTPAQMEQIKIAAEKSKAALKPPAPKKNINTMSADLDRISKEVEEYFKDSKAILISSKEELHSYVDECIKAGMIGIDCETTGLDVLHDTIVGFSLYAPGSNEAYIPCKHLIPIFDTPYKNQVSYEDCRVELLRLVKHNVKLIFGNADFDLSMFSKDIGVDLSPIFFYDVILGWRCLKENELDNRLKILYNKYVLKGKGDPKTFSDFFPVALFPYCKPAVAKLYAAYDAFITYDLAEWQFQYCIADSPKCKKKNLEAIANLIWKVEMPLVSVCQHLHHTGVHIDKQVANIIKSRYRKIYEVEIVKLRNMVQEAIDNSGFIPNFGQKVPFRSGSEFNPDSNPQMKHLLLNILNIPKEKIKDGTGKETLSTLNLPITDEINKVRSLKTVIGSFTDKLPSIVCLDNRIHARFKQIGADTGRFSSSDPNLQNIPSHLTDIRHMFRATPKSIDKYHCDITEDKNHIIVSVPRYYYLHTSEVEELKVADIQPGTLVHVLHNNKSEYTTVNSAVESDIRIEDIILTLDIFDDMGEYDIEVITPPYVMLSSDYSAQEPRLTAFIANDEKMQQAFKDGRDIYAEIASVSFGVPYENCLEFHPVTHEYQPDGKMRRSEAKTVLLGICYGRSVITVADQLYGHDASLSDKEKIAKAQHVFDSVMNALPGLRGLTTYSSQFATKYGYVETILGRRRHIPDMQLPEFEFRPMDGYVNPDVDPLDINTLEDKSDIPERIRQTLLKEFQGFKYFGQIVKRTKELEREYKIRVINNRARIEEARRKTVNSRVQGSAADQTKLAILMVENDVDWKKLGGRLLVPVHDELIAEVPIDSWEEGGNLLSSLMVKAADFLPFPSKCDVETTFRWYGLPYPCPYKAPESLIFSSDNFSNLYELDENEISWVQYCLVECEYLLPVIRDENGNKPNGIAAKGVNGVVTNEMKDCMLAYLEKYQITGDEFLAHIESVVFTGRPPIKKK